SLTVPDGDVRERLMVEVLSRHVPVTDADRQIVGCRCMERVFLRLYESWADHLADAILAAFPELSRAAASEAGWEYGYELIEPDDRNVFDREGHFISAAFAYRAAKNRIHEERHPDVPSLQYAIVRRRKAGPWEPAGGDDERQ